MKSGGRLNLLDDEGIKLVGPSELASDWLASQARTLLYMLRPTFRLAAELGFAPRPSGFRDR
jgi:hypothetical protein